MGPIVVLGVCTVVLGLVNRIMVVFRLAVVLSLASYTMPYATAAMHGSAYPDATVSVDLQHHGDNHSHSAEAHEAARGHHVSGGDSGEPLEKDCCQDFCFSIALPSSCESSVPPVRVSTVFLTLDDSLVHGTRPSLHRPPNI